MNHDTHLFFTRCHWLYVQGMRRAIRERLIAIYGDDWWSRGVLLAFPEAICQRLQNEAERTPGQEPHILLDASHFGRIVAQHHRTAFADVFSDSQRAYRDFGMLTAARNRWAHIQSISPAQAGQAVALMRQILTALRCAEALEIADMIQSIPSQPGDATEELFLPESEPADVDFGRASPENTLWQLWHQAHSYLAIEKTVVLSSLINGRVEWANVNIRIHNTAPDSRDLPCVHYTSVKINVPGIQLHSAFNDHRLPITLGELAPGQMHEIEMTFPAKQLLIAEFVVSGQIDTGKLFQFQQTTNLQGEIITTLQSEFANRLSSIAVNDAVKNVLDAISTITPDMKFADLIQIRQSLTNLSAGIDERRNRIDVLAAEFHLGRESFLGQRLREIMLALGAFNSKVSELDAAIGNTDLALISQSVSDLQQIQLSVLRVEDTIRAITDNG